MILYVNDTAVDLTIKTDGHCGYRGHKTQEHKHQKIHIRYSQPCKVFTIKMLIYGEKN